MAVSLIARERLARTRLCQHKKPKTTNKGKDVEPRLPSMREVVLKQGDSNVLFTHFNRSQCHEYGNCNDVLSYLNRAEDRIEKQVAPCHISNNIEHIQEEEDTTHECCVFMSFYKEFTYCQQDLSHSGQGPLIQLFSVPSNNLSIV